MFAEAFREQGSHSHTCIKIMKTHLLLTKNKQN